MALPLLRAADVACRRGERLLFDGLGLEVHSGEIVWVRGANGRGKTSLLKLLAGLSMPERGDVSWDGVPVRRSPAYRRQLVFVGHADALKEDLTVSEALRFLLQLHAVPHDHDAVGAALERLGLHGRSNAAVRTLSQGQRRRVALARLAVPTGTAPWILDEPADSLDSDGFERLHELLAAHAQRGGRVVLSSHQRLHPRLGAREVDLDRYAR
jgi:heme exporter protein A